MGDGAADFRLLAERPEDRSALVLANRLAGLTDIAVGFAPLLFRLRGSGVAKGADVTALSLAKPPGRGNVGETEDVCQDTSGHTDVPEDGPHLLLGEAAVAQLSENVGTHHKQRESKPCQAAPRSKSRPVPVEPCTPDTDLGEAEKEACDDEECHGDVAEEGESIGHLGNDHEDGRGDGDDGKDDDVTSTDNVEDDEPQALAADVEASHLAEAFSSWKVSCMVAVPIDQHFALRGLTCQ